MINHEIPECDNNDGNDNDDDLHLIKNLKTPATTTSRRRLLQRMAVIGTASIATTSILFPSSSSVCHAGDLGERLNRAVTQSDLGIQVRREVVRGAQILDRLDGQWENLSDKFQLGTERSKQAKRPPPKSIPLPQPLDVNIARQWLQLCDQAFLHHTQQQQKIIGGKELEQSIQRIAILVQPSFERAGLQLPTTTTSTTSLPLQQDGRQPVVVTTIDDTILNGEQFNFWSYVHFRAYADLMTKGLPQRPTDTQNYANFKTSLEEDLGQQLLLLLTPDLATSRAIPSISTSIYNNNNENVDPSPLSSSTPRWSNLQSCLEGVDVLLSKLVQVGWVASTDRSPIHEEDVEDWLEGLSDLSITIALDGDVTLGAQTLLQEQGFRLYPDYAKWAVSTLLSQSGESVQIDDYYFDTDYNPDPNQYQVKEVLLNVVIKSS